METVTLSKKFQVVIPQAIREQLGLTPSQKLQTMLYGDRIELIPLQPAKRLRGFLKGIDASVPREGVPRVRYHVKRQVARAPKGDRAP